MARPIPDSPERTKSEKRWNVRGGYRFRQIAPTLHLRAAGKIFVWSKLQHINSVQGAWRFVGNFGVFLVWCGVYIVYGKRDDLRNHEKQIGRIHVQLEERLVL